MRRAGPQALDTLEPLLVAARKLPGLVESKRGIFYRKGRGFLHFHEDAAGMFADLKVEHDGDFERFRVSPGVERKAFLAALRVAVSP